MLEGVTAQPPSDGMSSDPVSVLVLAAGEGTRMRSATPKVLHRIAGRSLLEHSVRAAAGIAPDELSVVIGHGRQAVGQHLERLESELDRGITPVVQEEQLGTGHAVRCATDQRDSAGTVVVTYGDIPLLDADTLASLLREHRRRNDAVTVLTAVVDEPHGYGRVLRDGAGDVTAIVEQKDADSEQAAVREINSGVYAFDARFLDTALRRLSTDNSQGELYLTDVVEIARGEGRGVGALVCADNWLVEGVNDRVQLASVSAEHNRRLVRHWMREGVTVTDPSSVWLDSDVVLDRDVVLEPNVQLRGGTSVAEGAHIGPDTTLTDCSVGTGAHVVRSHGENAEVGPAASVGPFAYLRSGTRLGSDGKVGTFVEVKNAEIGEGSKVPHLSYVGDATIGTHSNIGAATVFVNYDGVAKHHTVIGSHSRTGADNMFVAPVRVDDGAYTAAGSVITEDVPPGAMAVARGRQRNIEGWVAKRRPGTAADEAAQRALADRDNSTETDE
ncbi:MULTISPECIES: bifunctional UDP-N-acetylglucosamine diphosphorylase/glucosamine-1-phosphate N-acetyltransferase GlmU [unclassified Actinopolyspora]|uniref:bifunctional UDP-N-acetylglucosamine diphosphorylase/glucosamine-1-phosphate N-acetyltransferase GlmU n=1 Tax=Actinopolyspora TaxID=1849 RepID=UPI0013F63B03|nr:MULTISPECIES: bifunctional UDP-N-acetylglucosamine diphosphorylase/glucosamine-1-phosphate N-acetyltransferase GlmU [unclassified Actinopolyspora]NHD16798.1 bifunctional UDP-N-acetylglucosamine diphosphorylase/glucosamine-1-phosphate N-acetyltransferase GlmU [Actinopolyspora sp. BKK2]NHE75339.1 bifunctional UDP-N-acetylglucosamine diphosphorylase/glucosamine-1-phosphate N-acetyltransferase GlmU [Actinopolyspora sp. BKK1]